MFCMFGIDEEGVEWFKIVLTTVGPTNRKNMTSIAYKIIRHAFGPPFFAFKKESNIKLKKAVNGRIRRAINSPLFRTFKKLIGINKILKKCGIEAPESAA